MNVRIGLTVEQRGMWAMIGTCIAMAIWTSGLLYMTSKSEKKRLAELSSQDGVEDNSSTKDHEAERIV